MKTFLVVYITDYKGGEISTVETTNTFVEALYEISDFTPNTLEEWKDYWIDLLKNNKSRFLSTDSYTFTIFEIENNMITNTLSYGELLSYIEKTETHHMYD